MIDEETYLKKLAAIICVNSPDLSSIEDNHFRSVLSRARADCEIRIWLKTRPWTRPPWQTGRRNGRQPRRDVIGMRD